MLNKQLDIDKGYVLTVDMYYQEELDKQMDEKDIYQKA